MSFLRSWLLAMVGAAAVCTLALTLCPEGRVRRVLRLVCGAVMAVALLSPLKDFDMDAYSASLSRYRDEAAKAVNAAEETGDRLNRTIIERDCAAYISDKADALGMTGVGAEVSAVWSDGCWRPDSAEITAAATEAQRAALTASIESELGIPESRQHWKEG